MFCPKCGKENPDIARFCAGCGATLKGAVKKAGFGQRAIKGGRAVAAAAGERAGAAVASGRAAIGAASGKGAAAAAGVLKGRVRLPVVIIIIAVIVAALLLWLLFVGGPGKASGIPEYKHYFETVYDEGRGETLIAVDGKAFKGSIDGELDYRSCGSDTDLFSEKTLYVDEEKTLWLLTPKKLEQVADNVAFASVSQNGNTVVYADEDGMLCLYTVSGKSKAVIDDDLFENSTKSGRYPKDGLACFTMSPDGKTICYYKYNHVNDEYTAYIYDGKESRKLKNDTVPVSVGDGGKHIYCFDTGRQNLVYFADASSNSVKVSGIDDIGFVLMNKSRTQMIFINDGLAYFTDRGSEKVKLSGSGYISVFPLAGPYQASYSYTMAPLMTSVNVSPAKSLKGQRYSIGNDASYGYSSEIVAFGAKGETNKIVSDVDVFCPAKNGAVYYTRKGNLYCTDDKGRDESERIARSVKSFAPASDGSRVYYLSEDEELYCIKGGGDPERITDEVHSIQLAYDDTLFFIADFSSRAHTGSLYGCKSGKDIEKIMDDVLPAFESCYGNKPYTLFYEESGGKEYDIYTIRSGVKAEVLFTGVVQ